LSVRQRPSKAIRNNQLPDQEESRSIEATVRFARAELQLVEIAESFVEFAKFPWVLAQRPNTDLENN